MLTTLLPWPGVLEKSFSSGVLLVPVALVVLVVVLVVLVVVVRAAVGGGC